MSRNWSNPVTQDTLEEACERLNNSEYVHRIGMVVSDGDQEYTLAPQHDSVGFAPRPGDIIEASALGLGKRATVVRVAQGYPGQWQII